MNYFARLAHQAGLGIGSVAPLPGGEAGDFAPPPTDAAQFEITSETLVVDSAPVPASSEEHAAPASQQSPEARAPEPPPQTQPPQPANASIRMESEAATHPTEQPPRDTPDRPPARNESLFETLGHVIRWVADGRSTEKSEPRAAREVRPEFHQQAPTAGPAETDESPFARQPAAAPPSPRDAPGATLRRSEGATIEAPQPMARPRVSSVDEPATALVESSDQMPAEEVINVSIGTISVRVEAPPAPAPPAKPAPRRESGPVPSEDRTRGSDSRLRRRYLRP